MKRPDVRTGRTRAGSIVDGVGHIPLTRGFVALVDAELLEWLTQWNWSAVQGSTGTYARRKKRRPEKGVVQMHRLIVGAHAGCEVDHRDGNTLDNRRTNLRIATRITNGANRKPQRGGTSQYKGVSWDSAARRWRVTLRREGRQLFIGRYTDEIEAAGAYDRAAQEYFGVFARLNGV